MKREPQIQAMCVIFSIIIAACKNKEKQVKPTFSGVFYLTQYIQNII